MLTNQSFKENTRHRQDDEIDLLSLFSFYLNKVQYLVLALIVGSVIAGLFTHFFIPNKYTATARMYMVSASSNSVLNISDLNLGTSISNDYVELMRSRPVIEDVIEKLDLDMTYGQVAQMITLSVVNNTRIVKISVTGTDPSLCKDIANQVALTSKAQLPKVMKAPSPTIAEEAILPKWKSSPSLKRNIIAGGIIGLVIAIGILTIIYLLDDTIKTSEDIERILGVMPLSVVPEGKLTYGADSDRNTSLSEKTTRNASK